MIRNGRDIPTGEVLSTQVCVIGSGPAGITAAWELQKAGIKVILIEGSRDYDQGTKLEDSWPDKILLYNGEADGLFAVTESDFLIRPFVIGQFPSERERYYGGTSAHWGGQSRPEDPIDLEERPGYLGWPLSREDLDPYYREASALCNLHGDYNLHGDNFSTEYWAGILQAQIPTLDGFDVEMYQYLGPDDRDFATRTFDGITIGQSPVDVILNASLLHIDHQQGSVAQLRVASMDTSGRPQKATEFTIKADAYVLACGAVANARQLLLSNAGNEYDLVGRYFMCHPLSEGQVINTLTPYLNPSEARLMSGHTPAGKWMDKKTGVTVSGRFIPNAEQTRNLGIGRCWFWYEYGQYYFQMAPNPDSRVTLSDKADPVFGQPQTKITWLLSELDEQTYYKTTALFKRGVNNLGGDVSFDSWDDVNNQLVVNGHHIGTTRMWNDPAKGVVNSDLKVHSLDNLYVAGSSVFPSTGISNPTFTIIMLSIRLAAHLTKVLGGRA
ncbi:MAG TPA: GMC family oxidoreductase [Blastocatellia bacterium]|nr:GMC family oxidoreductase [Blastocatellia bacterium]